MNALKKGLCFYDTVNETPVQNKVRGVITIAGSSLLGFLTCALVDRTSKIRPGVCKLLVNKS